MVRDSTGKRVAKLIVDYDELRTCAGVGIEHLSTKMPENELAPPMNRFELEHTLLQGSHLYS